MANEIDCDPDVEPSALEVLKDWIGIRVRLPDAPKTRKNADSAMGALLGGWSKRIRLSNDRKALQAALMLEAEKIVGRAGLTALRQEVEENPALARRAMLRLLGEETEKQQNREEVARLAIEHVAANATAKDAVDDIDPEWLAHFVRIAETKPDKYARAMWARVLASEIVEPGMSMRTLDCLSKLTKGEIETIAKALSLTVNGRELPNFATTSGRLLVGETLELVELGILSSRPSETSRTLFDSEATETAIFYFGWGAYVTRGAGAASLVYPAGRLTRVGQDLIKLADNIKPDPTYFRDFLVAIAQMGAEVQWGRLVEEEDGQTSISDVEVVKAG